LRFLKEPAKPAEESSVSDTALFACCLALAVCIGFLWFYSTGEVTLPSLNLSSEPETPFEMKWDPRNPQPERESVTLSITLKQAYLAEEVTFRPPRGIQKICTSCHGTGALHGKTEHYHTCPVCQGSGVEIVNMQLAPGFHQRVQRECSHCDGSGKVIKYKCPKCGGDGLIIDKNKIELQVPKGVEDGGYKLLEGQGHQIYNHPPGDILVTFRIGEGKKFKRKGKDLHYILPLTLKEQLLGFRKTITQMDGRKIPVRSNEIQPCEGKINIPREGMCDTRDRCGNLVVSFKCSFPSNIEDLDVLRELLPTDEKPSVARNFVQKEEVIYEDTYGL